MNNEVDSGGVGCFAIFFLLLFALGNGRTYPMLSLGAVALLLIVLAWMVAKDS